MTAPTGEAVNYETTLATVDGLIVDMQKQVDAATAALGSIAATKGHVDALQQTYASTAQAAQTKADHQAAMNLDGTTQGHAATTVDSLPPNAVDSLYEQLEEAERRISDVLQQAETALASLEAERAHLIATYGEAHATVAGNLGGDARFLDGGAGTTGGPTPDALATPSQSAALDVPPARDPEPADARAGWREYAGTTGGPTSR